MLKQKQIGSRIWQLLVHAILRLVLCLEQLYSSSRAATLSALLPEKVQRATKRGRQPSFPKTIALIFLEDPGPTDTEQQIANLVRRAREEGVQTVHLYHTYNWSAKSCKQLDSLLNYQADNLYSLKVGFGHSIGNVSESRRDDGSSAAETADTTKVVLLDGQHASAAIQTAMGHCQQIGNNGAFSDETRSLLDMDSSRLYEVLSTVLGPDAIEEPSFVLVFGPCLCLAGFPPWLLRHSEIYAAGSLAKASESVIPNALHKFLRTSQRFGT